MIAHVYLDKVCLVPQHSHENEQLTYILEGRLRFFLGKDESEVVVAYEVWDPPRDWRLRLGPYGFRAIAGAEDGGARQDCPGVRFAERGRPCPSQRRAQGIRHGRVRRGPGRGYVPRSAPCLRLPARV
jgi:hypothetical protein